MADTSSEPPLTINTQYIKDMSFENPRAPESLVEMSKQDPAMEINIDVKPAKLQDRLFEIVLSLRAEAKAAGNTAFLIELDYAGLVTIGDTVTDAEPLLLIETPRYLFPFARNIISEISRNGGFPPLLINPIDFHAMYLQREQAAQSAAAKAEAESTQTAEA